jgi:phosphopentomutase
MFHNNFIYNLETANENPKSFENQIAYVQQELNKKKNMNHFVFINCGSTHTPYCGFGLDHEAQVEALEYVDSHIMSLIDSFPKPLIVKIFGDHGDCFGEDDMYGHSFYHPKVMEVPGLYLELF